MSGGWPSQAKKRGVVRAGARSFFGRLHGPRFLPAGLGLDGLGAAGPTFTRRRSAEGCHASNPGAEKAPEEREHGDAAGGTRDECSPETGLKWHPKSMSIATGRSPPPLNVCNYVGARVTGHARRVPPARGSESLARRDRHPKGRDCASRSRDLRWLGAHLRLERDPAKLGALKRPNRDGQHIAGRTHRLGSRSSKSDHRSSSSQESVS
jgi:hypothetical protein